MIAYWQVNYGTGLVKNFDTEPEAVAAYDEAKQGNWGQFATIRSVTKQEVKQLTATINRMKRRYGA